MCATIQAFGFNDLSAVDVDVIAWPSEFAEEHVMVCASQCTRPPECIGAMVLRLDGCLRAVIGVEAPERIVVSHAGHDDVAFPHMGRTRVMVHDYWRSCRAGECNGWASQQRTH